MTYIAPASERAIRELANCIALQASTVAEGTQVGTCAARAKLIYSNAETLLAWCERAESVVRT